MFKRRQEPVSQSIQGFGPVTPKSRRRIVAAFCLAAAGAAAVILTIQWNPGFADTDSLARIGQRLPPLVVENSEGRVDLNSFISGTRSVIVFYSSSCKTCQKVLPALQPFPETLRLILISESSDQDNTEISGLQDAARFWDRRRVLPRFFAAAAVPAILFVDEEGILRDGMVGYYRRRFVQHKLKDFAAHSCNRARDSRWIGTFSFTSFGCLCQIKGSEFSHFGD